MNNNGESLKMPNALRGLNASPDDFTSGDFLTQDDMVQTDLGSMPGAVPPDTSNFPDLHNMNSIPGTKRQSEIEQEVLSKLQESKAKRIDDAIAKDIESVKTKTSLPKNPLSALKELIQQGELTDTFELYGLTWKMRALDQNDLLLSLDAIKDTLDTSSGRFMALTTAQVVYSIEEINNIPIYSLFPDIKLEDFNNDEQEYIFAIKRALKKYLTSLPPKIIDDLYFKYTELDEKRNQAIDDLKNS